MTYRRKGFIYAAKEAEDSGIVVSIAIDEHDGKFAISAEVWIPEGFSWGTEPADTWGEFDDLLFSRYGDYDVFFDSEQDARTAAFAVFQQIEQPGFVEIFNCLEGRSTHPESNQAAAEQASKKVLGETNYSAFAALTRLQERFRQLYKTAGERRKEAEERGKLDAMQEEAGDRSAYLQAAMEVTNEIELLNSNRGRGRELNIADKDA